MLDLVGGLVSTKEVIKGKILDLQFTKCDLENEFLE